MIREVLNAILALSLLTAPAAAQIERATVSVDGMSCPFCAFGVEKRLRRVEGVAAVEVAMEKGTATVTAAEEGSIDVAAIPEAVRKAGFTPGPVQVVALGTVRRDTRGDGPVRRVLGTGDGGPDFLLVNLSAEQRRAIDELSGTGSPARVTGEVHFHADELPGLAPERIEKAG